MISEELVTSLLSYFICCATAIGPALAVVLRCIDGHVVIMPVSFVDTRAPH